jgi:hypothetical protein
MAAMAKAYGRMRLVVAAGTILACRLAWCPCALALNSALDVSQHAHTAWKIREGFSEGNISLSRLSEACSAQSSHGRSNTRRPSAMLESSPCFVDAAGSQLRPRDGSRPTSDSPKPG